MNADGARRCPTCGARRNEDRLDATGRVTTASCRRCGTDFRLLVSIEDRAEYLCRAALQAYRRGCFRTAAGRAAEAVRLEASPEALRLLAAASLRAGDYAAAVRAARRLGARTAEGAAGIAGPR